MHAIDAFGKPIQEFRVKTTCGGYLSICSFFIIFVLFVTELQYFLQLESKDEMVIDHNQDQKHVNITLNITFFEVPCALLYMNVIDPKKSNVLHVVHDIRKTRFSKSGKQLGLKIRDSLTNVAQTSAELMLQEDSTATKLKAPHVTAHLRCGSCFQARMDEDDCCSTCEDVETAFAKRGWHPAPSDYVFGQCTEAAYMDPPPEMEEGCQIEASLYVRKVAATIHMGVGRHVNPEWLARKDTMEFVNSLNISHLITSVAFGPDFPGLVHILDGRLKKYHIPRLSEHFQYDIHVIPTSFQQEGSPVIESNQYSVLEYVKSINQRNRHQDLVTLGFWANYDFTPFEVKVTWSRKSLWHFATECCAILGGIFAFTGMLDNLAHRVNKSMMRRRRRNLAGITQPMDD